MSDEITLPTGIKITKKEPKKAIIEIEGCYPGYGITLANSLRRILLSSLKGAAVTNFKIKGVDHEFSTISGILEDVIQISLNLKQLRFRVHSDKEQKLTLKGKGERKFTAKDLKTPPEVEVINKDAHLITLTDKKSKLEMEMTVNTGYGYESSEEGKKEKLPIGTISLDAAFSPVRKVSYEVEEMRVGERTDYNRIILEIDTDASITPEEAFRKASEILKNQFDFLGTKKAKIIEEKKEEPEKKKKLDPSGLSLDDLGIPTRIANILEDNRIKTAAGLIQRKKETLEKTKGLGPKSVEKIGKALDKYGLKLK